MSDRSLSLYATRFREIRALNVADEKHNVIEKERKIFRRWNLFFLWDSPPPPVLPLSLLQGCSAMIPASTSVKTFSQKTTLKS